LRFLMLCMQFPTAPGQGYLTNELADALVADGHAVDVLLLDWRAPPGGPVERLATASGVRVLRCPPHAVDGLGALARNASKFVLSGAAAARAARRHLDLGGFDAVIAWAPAVAFAPVLELVRQAPCRILFIWDFFPDHHRQIGRIPGGPPYWIARAWEQRLMAGFTAIVCTLDGNAGYLRRNFRLADGQKVLVSPIWSAGGARAPVDRAAVRRAHGLDQDRPIAVFGGQLVEGRGFEQMLGAAAAGGRAGSELQYLFVGDGRLEPLVSRRAGETGNVVHRPGIPREAYMELLGACDVGMAATTPGVTSFSFPSKTVDYLRAGLPVIAAVEHGSDFVSILERYGVGASVGFGEPEAFHREAERLATCPETRTAVREAAPRCLDEVFDVRHAVRTVMEAVGA
jgi:glycosyltransferase involved in cell wall biosynthesis